MAELVLGPLQRYVGKTEATIWVETDAACEVTILGRTAKTFCVAGHHYALVMIDDLEPGSSQEYEVELDGERCWPPEDWEFPASVLRTFRDEEEIELVFGSCRVTAPHEPPYSLPKELDEENGRGIDALRSLALEILRDDSPRYPDLLFLCGDQVYADEVSPETLQFIHSRPVEERPADAPDNEVADFEEYSRLYREAWSDPLIRWFLSTVSSSMVIDDHDMHDDWNISERWCDEMDAKPWWHERVIGGMTSYWVYQFIGNLAPGELAERPLWKEVQEAEDAEPVLREFMAKDDREREGKRWSYFRDLGTTRLIVVDVRTGRCVEEGDRKIVDDDEWDWIVERATEAEFDHLVFGTSDPYLLAPTFHHLEAWNERICEGDGMAAQLGERMRQALDFDHWAAFQDSFRRLTGLIQEIGSGKHGRPPATIGALSGDVHHAYLADVAFRRGSGVQSVVYQAVCSPYRNPLDDRERRTVKFALTRPVSKFVERLAAAAGVKDTGIRWRFREGPYFDNQIATLKLKSRSAAMELEKVPRDRDGRAERLERIFEVTLT